MLFNSFDFLIFFPIVFLLYWFVFQKRLIWQNALVLVASYFFYGWWSWKFMGLLVLSTLLDYTYGFSVASPNRKKAKFFLWLGIINNLGILGIFKYYNFFAVQFQQGLEYLGLHTNPVLLNIALPVGISFYTFHGMSYVFDIYRGQQKPVKNFIDYAVFVSFFPLLVAGPIERASHLLPQIQKVRNLDKDSVNDGIRLMIWGFFKKVVIADNLAVFVDGIFKNYHHENGVGLLIGAISFSFQIYGDFSGYSDIASGTAKLFGFDLLRNFEFPYFSRDIAEFWRRWHISLSSWFRDYLYIPLGGSRNGKFKSVRNTFIIFLVSGFWHGASWNFIIWGFVHACGFLPLLIFNRNRRYSNDIVAQNKLLPNITEVFQMLSTFAFVTFAWVFFRANSLSDAYFYFYRLLKTPDIFLQFSKFQLYKNQIITIFIFIFLEWYDKSRSKNRTIEVIMNNLFLLAILLFMNMGNSTFIYFQF